MVKKAKVKQKQRQSQKQIVNINLGKVTKPKKRGKRKTQIKKPVLYQSINYQVSQPQQPPSVLYPSSQTPSLLPPPIARSSAVAESLIVPAPIIEPLPIGPLSALPQSMRTQSLPRRVSSAIGSAVISSGLSGLSSLFQPLPPFPAREEVPFSVREEPPAFANVEPVFAEPPFPLVPYQVPLPAPEDEFFDYDPFNVPPEDPFNLEQPPKDVFNVAPATAPAVEEEPEYLPYSPSQIEDLRTKTALYTAAEPFGPTNETFLKTEQPNLLLNAPLVDPFGQSVVEINDPFSAPVVAPFVEPVVEINEPLEKPKPQKKKVPTKPAAEEKPELTPKQYLAKLKKEEEAEAKREAKRREKGKDVRGLFPVEAQPVILGEPVFEESQKEKPAFGLEVIQRATPQKEKGGLERVRPEEQTEEPLQYGFSN